MLIIPNTISLPLGNYSDKIKINFYKILIKKIYRKFYKHFKKIKIKYRKFYSNTIINFISSFTKDEKELGTICIDLGHSSSSISIFENNKFVFGDTIRK